MAIVDLAGKKGLIIGIANDQSIAWGCAQSMREAGAELAVTYLNEKAQPHVKPLAELLQSPVCLPLDVSHDEEMATLFSAIKDTWGRLDFLLHAIAFAPTDDLHGRVTDCSREGFLTAMDISCHSLMRLSKAAEPLMSEGGSILTLSYYGSEQVVPHYNLMGPVKAALESSVRYLASELGPTGIRVNALSPGPIRTRAASGLAQFDQLLDNYEHKSPLHQPLALCDIGPYAAFLASDAARAVTGAVHYIDGGYDVVD